MIHEWEWARVFKFCCWFSRVVCKKWFIKCMGAKVGSDTGHVDLFAAWEYFKEVFCLSHYIYINVLVVAEFALWYTQVFLNYAECGNEMIILWQRIMPCEIFGVCNELRISRFKRHFTIRCKNILDCILFIKLVWFWPSFLNGNSRLWTGPNRLMKYV